jgi:hypothetical protein
MRPIRWLRRPSTTAPMTNAGEIAGTFSIVGGVMTWITDGVLWGMAVWFVGGILSRFIDRRAGAA